MSAVIITRDCDRFSCPPVVRRERERESSIEIPGLSITQSVIGIFKYSTAIFVSSFHLREIVLY